MTIKAPQLKKGMRFSEIPAAWHGPGTVSSVYTSGDSTVCIRFENQKIINPPGIIYVSPDAKFRLLKPLKSKLK